MSEPESGAGPNRSNSQILLPWLSVKEKFSGALLISIAFAVCVATLVFTSIFTVPRMSKPAPKDYYPDIVKDTCSTCWESTVFATSSDPFYKWVVASSLPDELNISQRGTIAYQKASIWRVAGGATKTETSVYSSPDPHIFGGAFIKRSKTLVWKMTINWGVSVRYCFTLPDSVGDPCLYTAPIVRSPGNTASSYSALMIGVPFRNSGSYSTSNISSSYLDKQATYLTNFVSNARTGPGLKLRKNKHDQYYVYMYEGNTCRKASPVFVTPDVFSYLGFPCLQCACSGHFCLIGLNFAKGSISPLELNATGCRESRSFWDFDRFPVAQQRISFYTYSPRWNTSVTLDVNLTIPFKRSLVPELEKFTSCVEDFMEAQAPNSATFTASLSKQCSSPEVVGLEPTFKEVFDRYKSRGPLQLIKKTFSIDEVQNDDNDDDALCGLDQGQVKLADNLCAMSLEDLRSAEAMEKLDRRLRNFQRVPDVKKFKEKEWEKGYAQRSDIIIGIITAVVTILLTVLGMFNRELQEVEEKILKWMKKFYKAVNETVGLAAFKTWVRAMLLLGVMIWNMSNVYRSLSAVETEPRVATSGALLQQLHGISFLVTSSSTVQVIPQWIVFYACCCVVAFLFVVVVFGVYVRMRYVEEGMTRGTRRG